MRKRRSKITKLRGYIGLVYDYKLPVLDKATTTPFSRYGISTFFFLTFFAIELFRSSISRIQPMAQYHFTFKSNFIVFRRNYLTNTYSNDTSDKGNIDAPNFGYN